MGRHNRVNTTVLGEGYARVMLIELKSALREGDVLFVRYGGHGMDPLLRANRDKVYITPLPQNYKPERLDVLAIEIGDECQLRHFLAKEGDDYLVIGDSCRYEESVRSEQVLGLLTQVERCDGTRLMCSNVHWRKASQKAVNRRRFINKCKNIFGGKNSKYWTIAYFAFLVMSMWLPLSNVQLMDNYILGLRSDHVFHGSVYCLCAYFIYSVSPSGYRRWWHWALLWFTCILVAMVTEFVQKLLPYRSFDINDLIANFMGVTIGWIVILFVHLNMQKRY